MPHTMEVEPDHTTIKVAVCITIALLSLQGPARPAEPVCTHIRRPEANEAWPQGDRNGVNATCASAMKHCCTVTELNIFIPGLSELFARNGSQSVVGWYPEMWSPAV
jgi:hypothetical protein